MDGADEGYDVHMCSVHMFPEWGAASRIKQSSAQLHGNRSDVRVSKKKTAFDRSHVTYLGSLQVDNTHSTHAICTHYILHSHTLIL